MTNKQATFLRDLIVRHPNFKRETKFDGTLQDESGVRYYRLSGKPYPNDKIFIGYSEFVQADWINKKYFQWLPNPIKTIYDLDTETASALITRLQLGEQERQERNT